MIRVPLGPAIAGAISGATAVALVAVLALVLFGGTDRLPWSPVARGERIYAASCQSCHGGRSGGEMMDYPPRHNANGHTWHHSDCELEDVILTGGGPMVEMMREMMAPPGAPEMPAFVGKLSDEEIDLVLAFIKTMWTPGQRAQQEAITRSACRPLRGEQGGLGTRVAG